MRRFLVPPPSQVGERYSPVILRPEGLAARAASEDVIRRVLEVVQSLEHDAFTAYMMDVYRAGLERFGPYFRYLDITTVLSAAAELGQPERYLEIGVRRGRSMCVVAAICPNVSITGFDLWQPEYGNNENPGPALVIRELRKVGHRGHLELIEGDSHETVPRFLADHPELEFDLITVDGDHTMAGAWDDLCHVAPRLRVGGVLVFDDTNNPYCPGLREVWRDLVLSDGGLAAASFDEVGTGVSFAIRVRPGSPPKRKRARRGIRLFSR